MQDANTDFILSSLGYKRDFGRFESTFDVYTKTTGKIFKKTNVVYVRKVVNGDSRCVYTDWHGYDSEEDRRRFDTRMEAMGLVVTNYD